MTRCPICAAEVPQASRFCLSCGTALTPEAATETLAAPRKPPSSSSSDEGRFPAGTVLGERYRVLGLLGRGGMGEVYRAFDLKLDQTVALKFLPAATARDSRLLERFRGEVRVARQVSHRNVCRVYDLGEIDGAPFISMEYVDGEDLGSLLRRIGRLPGDKAIEFSRRLCAGLAAAHEKGVLHRDLKPANIMIDGRGQVLIMDFGLAAAADAIAGGDIRSGTPAYMAPEQKEGREVTVRSDIYSLGLVMQEMFRGRDSSSTPKDLDPAVEKVIQRCLDPNPSKRPATALDLARALPGGDPLAEALAAGDTPSPEMVAASEDTGAVSVLTAILCFGFVLAGLIAVVFLHDQTSLLRTMPFPNAPEVLAQKARDLAVRFGYTNPPQDEASGFIEDSDYQLYAASNWTPDQYRARLATGRPHLISFWYRQSPRYLATLGAEGNVTLDDPPPIVSGMVQIQLDPQGRLFGFSAVPPQVEELGSGSFEWAELFEAAGLDRSQFQPVEPQWVPLVSFDARAAWTGILEGSPPVPIRLEAASWKGRPVYFDIVRPWARPAREQARPQTTGGRTIYRLYDWLLGAVFLTASLLAWRHYRSQRGDLRGSARLGAFAAGCYLLRWLFIAHHAPIPPLEYAILFGALSQGTFFALGLGGLYMALEPYVRRRWPQSLISWTRLLGGGFRDPLVGGHVLLGAALGLSLSIAIHIVSSLAKVPDTRLELSTLRGVGPTVGAGLNFLVFAIASALGLFLVFFLLRVALRRNWLAGAAVVVLTAVLAAANNPNQPGIVVGQALGLAYVVWVLLRFGVLPMVAAFFVFRVVMEFPITSNFSTWYSNAALLALGTILALAAWSFRNALGGRKVWKGDILES